MRGYRRDRLDVHAQLAPDADLMQTEKMALIITAIAAGISGHAEQSFFLVVLYRALAHPAALCDLFDPHLYTFFLRSV